jgi:sugar lactone lactonase YvrE
VVANCEVVCGERALTGESPLWSPSEQALYWIDTYRDRVYRLTLAGGSRDEWPTPSRVAAIGLADGGRIMVAMQRSLSLLDPKTGALENLAHPQPDQPEHVLNDGKTDRRGRFWYGSKDPTGTLPQGRLYRFGADHSVALMDPDYVLPNGPAWSPDNRKMYLADSRRLCIWAYDFDADAGSIRNRRLFATVPPNTGVPDGATVDEAGYLWSARSGGWAVIRHDPSGNVDRIIELPVARATSCTFGGDDFKTLFITTASTRLDDAALAAQPLAGMVLSVRTDVPGLAEPTYRD